MPSKSIFKSKTFWVNVLTAIGAYSGYLPQTSSTLFLALGANVALRVITESPVSVLADAATKP